MSAFASINAYLSSKVSSVLTDATIYSDQGKTLLDFLQQSAIKMPAVYINYEGFLNEHTYEARIARRQSKWGIYYYGRKVDVESFMFQISQAIHTDRRFTLTTDVEVGTDEPYAAKVTGGRYLGLDSGFDAYQIEVEIN